MSYFSSSNKTSQKRNKIRQTYYTAEIIRLIACIKISTLDLYIFHLHLFVNPPHYPPSPEPLFHFSSLSSILRVSHPALRLLHPALRTIPPSSGFLIQPPIAASPSHYPPSSGFLIQPFAYHIQPETFSKTAGSILEDSREHSRKQPGVFSKTAGSVLEDSRKHSQRQPGTFSKTVRSVPEDSWKRSRRQPGECVCPVFL